MVKYRTYRYDGYVDDFARDVSVIARRSTQAPDPGTGGGLAGQIINTGRCSQGANLFEPRKLEALLSDGSNFLYVLPTLENVEQAVQDLKNISGVECVNLIGEKWTFVPEFVFGGEYNRDASATLSDSTDRETFSFTYASDTLTDPITKRATIASEPEELKELAKTCLGDDVSDTAVCTTGVNAIKPRYFEILVKNSAEDSNTPVITRRAYSVGQDTVDCANDLAESAICLRYKGEDVRAIDLIVNQQESSEGG